MSAAGDGDERQVFVWSAAGQGRSRIARRMAVEIEGPAFRDPPRFQPEYFSLYGPYALLIPGSSEDHPEKRWPLDNFVQLARWLADNDITPVVIGGKAEGDIGMKIVRAEQRAKSLIGRTDLFQLATLSERALMAIGGDTGPMHLVATAGCTSLTLFFFFVAVAIGLPGRRRL